MERGISINIGLNEVDPAAYDGWSDRLEGCENDARAMYEIARGKGFQAKLLLSSHANSGNVLKELALAARDLKRGDILLVTFSGHGTQVRDVTNDDDDGKDEVWLLYDRFFLDDELFGIWNKFASGVRIFMLSDSCHSGTIATALLQLNAEPQKREVSFAMIEPVKFRKMPNEPSLAAYAQHKSFYDGLQWTNLEASSSNISASLILISACQDCELAEDGNPYGLFTETLLDVWDNGNFNGDYSTFYKSIVAKINGQVPNLVMLGAHDPNFERQVPFTVA